MMYQEAAGGHIIQVTIAPEAEGALNLLKNVQRAELLFQ
jgi:N-acetylglucosamine-6-phosphate deacetylase